MLTLYSRRRQEPATLTDEQLEALDNAATGARRCVAYDDDEATAGEGAGVFIWPMVVLAVVGLVSLVVWSVR